MFVHAWLAHIAFNMLTLWMFGPRLEHVWGTRSFLQFYIWCGLGGAIAHLIFAQHTAVIGASGAISGVLVAYALRWPDEEVYLFGVIPMKSRWLIAAMIGMNIIFASVAELGDRLDRARGRNGVRVGGSQACRRWADSIVSGVGFPRCRKNRRTCHARFRGIDRRCTTRREGWTR